MKKEVHLCPILMKTVVWKKGKCAEECKIKECPFLTGIKENPEDGKQ